jgi:hypothetical protein
MSSGRRWVFKTERKMGKELKTTAEDLERHESKSSRPNAFDRPDM